MFPLLLLAVCADPDLDRARHLAQATFAFERHVFNGRNFPAGKLKADPALNALFSDETPIRVRFFDAERKEVTRPEKPGPYAAVVTVEPKGQRPLTRFITLYRTAKKEGDLATVFGVDPKVLKRNDALTKKISDDERAARLLAGLYLSKPADGPANKWDDALAVERQWWVDLKAEVLYPGVRLKPGTFRGPPVVEGKGFPTLRVGTEKEAGMKDGTAAKIDAVLQAFAKDTDHAFAVCIARNGVIVLHKAYGERDGKPMTVDTPSWMASVTKTMSATLMLQLIDRGLVKLDDPVSKYLPPLRGIKQKTPLTIHHLYTHTNGLTLDGLPGWNDEMHDVPERVASYYDRLRVGETWSYTGTGNMLGSKALEVLTGKAMPQAYREYLLKPLGCTNTHVTDTHAGAYSVPLDMAKFGQMLLQKGGYGMHRYFMEETFEKVMLPGELTKLAPTKRVFGFGLDGSAKRFGHGTASGAVFHIDAERKLVLVMTRNKYGKNQDRYNGLLHKAISEGIE
jgi:CubicO group peptidase (beta-lactamase class C family)